MGIAKAKIDIRLAEAKVRSIDRKFYKQQKNNKTSRNPPKDRSLVRGSRESFLPLKDERETYLLN